MIKALLRKTAESAPEYTMLPSGRVIEPLNFNGVAHSPNKEFEDFQKRYNNRMTASQSNSEMNAVERQTGLADKAYGSLSFMDKAKSFFGNTAPAAAKVEKTFKDSITKNPDGTTRGLMEQGKALLNQSSEVSSAMGSEWGANNIKGTYTGSSGRQAMGEALAENEKYTSPVWSSVKDFGKEHGWMLGAAGIPLAFMAGAALFGGGGQQQPQTLSGQPDNVQPQPWNASGAWGGGYKL